MPGGLSNFILAYFSYVFSVAIDTVLHVLFHTSLVCSVSPMGRNASTHSESPVRGRSSPRRRSPPRREKSPPRHRSSHKAISPPRDKPANQTRSPRRGKSRSPSPRTKRLKRAEVERGTEKVSVSRENERHNSRGDDRATRRERGSEKEVPSEKRERRSGRDAADGGSSRSRHGRSTSPSDRHRSSRHRSRSPRVASDMSEVTNSRGAEHRNGDNDSVAIMKATEEALETKEKQKPSFELSGKLAAETNRVKGVTLLFNEPPEARKPDIRWRLYVFKGGEVLNEPLYVHRQSCYLFGRERRVADIPTDHPSCSKQHAVLQYRQVEKEQPDGTSSKKVWPYLMDLGSTNGTFVNENRIEPQRYYELFERDTIKFGNSRSCSTLLRLLGYVHPRICTTARELSSMSQFNLLNYQHVRDIKRSCLEKPNFTFVYPLQHGLVTIRWILFDRERFLTTFVCI
ncbi:hypothetical protein RHMOL_Rhmol04G0025000 [Rhododendron molle]|uniref:Uncharacterized protein n=1 Tax=Rhododendron molle TaxID=49168 RepID=A0ACC0NWC9_RHOML|nr:hypothetical protein RHMOL_Rhmol04G0025000 [Rhododendron molle]